MQTKLRSIQSPVLSFVSQKQLSVCHSNVRQRGQTLGEDDGREPHWNVFAWELGYFAVADKTQRARVTDIFAIRCVASSPPWLSPSPASSYPGSPPASASHGPTCASRSATSPPPPPPLLAPTSLPARRLVRRRPRPPRRRRRRRSSKWARGHASSRRTSRGTLRPTKCARSSRTTAPSSASR